jgi:hypothetical protein
MSQVLAYLVGFALCAAIGGACRAFYGIGGLFIAAAASFFIMAGALEVLAD